MKYEFPTAFFAWSKDEEAAIDRVRASGQWTQAGEVEAFEHEIAAFHGRKHAIFVNSGSSANLLMVAALFNKRENPLRRGDRAIVPAIAWPTLYSPLVQHGMDLVVADVDDSWCAREISFWGTPPRLIVSCPVLGNPQNEIYRVWKALSANAPLYCIEDSCESLGARTDHSKVSQAGKLCGTFGLMSSLSFFISHQLSAIEGGAILCDDDEMAHLCRLLRNHGNEGFVSKTDDFDARYNFVLHGYNVRGTELHAAIAREQLKKLPTFIAARRDNYEYFAHLTERLPITLPKPNGQMSPFGFAFECMDGSTRAKLVPALRAESIDCRPPCGGSFLCHPYGAPWRDQRTPRADLIHSRAMFLGLAPYPIPHLIEKAVGVMRRVL